MEKKIIFIGGINGTGKSTVGKELSKSTGIPFYEGSTELMKELGLDQGDYNLLRKVTEREKKMAIENIFRRINNLPDIEKAIITGHFVKIVNGKVTKYNGPWLDFCSHLIHVSSNPSLISNRIINDSQQGVKVRKINKDNGDVDFLNTAQTKSLASFQDSVRKYCSTGLDINNNGDLSSTITDICSKIEI